MVTKAAVLYPERIHEAKLTSDFRPLTSRNAKLVSARQIFLFFLVEAGE